MNLLFTGALLACLSVALGAFGAHALKRRIDAELLRVYETGVSYQMYHSLALLGIGILDSIHVGGALITLAGWLFLAGIVLFSGSLYILSLSGKRVFGAITPIGGVCFLAGWVAVLIAVA